MSDRLSVILLVCAILAGCGTTKWTDTRRSATEQLLISDAMDRAVSQLDFRALAGKTVYLDEKPLKSVTDAAYLVSSLRQHMLASGCAFKDKQTEADYIVEIRAGAVGTDHHDLIYGVPAVNIPAMIPIGGIGIPSQIPEMPFVKKTEQRAVAKIAVFAYNRQTGRPVWQSGVVPMESVAKNFWVFGAGPFQRGTIYGGVSFAGDKLNIPLIDLGKRNEQRDPVSVADEAYFLEPEQELVQKTEAPEKEAKPAAEEAKVIQTGHALPTAKKKEEAVKGTASETAPDKTPAAEAPLPSATPPSGAAPVQEPAIQSPPANASPIDPIVPTPPTIRLTSESLDPAWTWPEETAPTPGPLSESSPPNGN